jgi:Fe2+ or Zn2+ uptake regulation protein
LYDRDDYCKQFAIRKGESVQNLIERLHAQGGRLTPQRRLIFETLVSLQGHPTAEEVYALVRHRAPKLHLSTVYRTLRWLEQEGLVSSRLFQEDRRQERFDSALPTEHHHFVCTTCKRVIEFKDPIIERVKENFSLQTSCRVQLASVELYGICPNCCGKEDSGIELS